MSETRFSAQPQFPIDKRAIAIIGMGMRFPSNIKNEKGMWEALMSGKSAISKIPEERWPTDVLQHPTRGEPGRSVSFSAGILQDAFLFDPSFFNISPREAAWMDPQQRLLLEMTHEAMEDAGLTDQQYRGSECGVYIGVSGMDYGQNALMDLSSISAHTMTGNTLSIVANRISYIFDLHGPSLAIDTACSSSLAALHEACQALISGAIPMALAGGINMLMHPYPFIGFSHASMLSASGQCRPFDAAGDGYVRGEGGAILILKPLDRALADRNHIHAVIMQSGVNSDGAGKKGLTIPSCQAQTELMSGALARSGLEANDISYVEAHGTGTPVGDPAEAESIGKAYGKYRSRPLPVSSAKANFGHLEPASGMAGIIKAILVLKHGQIPPMPFDYNPNPHINFKDLNIYCAADGETLKSDSGKPLIGAVNSFGFGGLNAHILLRQSLPDENPATDHTAPTVPLPLVISAKTRGSLARLAENYADLLESLPEENFTDLAWNALFRRSMLEKRLALIADSKEERIKALRDFSQGKSSRQISVETALPRPGRIAFIYNGNGAQWHGMGRQLYQESPAFARILDYLDKEMEKVFGWSILDMLFTESEEAIQDTAVSQPLLFAIQSALTSLFKEMGIEPEATCGHSVGEIAAAWGAGALNLDEAIRIIYARSTAQEKTRGMGRMAAIGLGANEALAELDRLGLSGKIEIAAANSPHNSTLSGDEEALIELGKSFEGKNIFFRMLDLDYAFHSRHMDQVKDFMKEMLDGLAPSSSPKNIFISTVRSRSLSSSELNADYWWDNMRHVVNFDAAIRTLYDLGINIFIEIGPHAILQRYIRENLPENHQARVLPSLQQSSAGIERILSTAASTYLLAPSSTVQALFPDQASWINLPAYPWEHQNISFPYTVEKTFLPTKLKPLLGWQLPGLNPVWETIVDPLKDLWVNDHKVGNSIVFPAAGYVEMALEAAAQWHETSSITLENFDILLPLVFENNRAQTLRCEINALDGSFSIQSRVRMENSPWLTHAKGRIIYHKSKTPVPALKHPDEDITLISRDELYAKTKKLGLDYGPFFSRVESLSVKDNHIEATIEEIADAPDFILNPGFIDACFHSLAAIYASGQTEDTYLPVGFRELKLFNSNPVKYIRGVLLKQARRTIHADFELYDNSQGLVARFSDCRFRKMPKSQNPAIDAWFYRKFFKPLPTRSGVLLENPAAVAQKIIRDHKFNPSRKLWYQEVLPRIEASVLAFINDFLTKAGVSDILPASMTEWMKDLYSISETSGDIPDWKKVWQETHNLAPHFLPALLPVGRVMEQLSRTAQKKISVSELLAANNTILQENSVNNPAYSGIDQILDKFLNALVKPNAAFNIAEASSYQKMPDSALAEKIESGHVNQTFILAEGILSMPLFRGSSQNALMPDPLKWFEKKNENRPYDIIVIRQLLHSAPDLRESLQAISSSLAPGGILVFTERYPDWSADLTSGLKENWWRKGSDNKVVSSRMAPESWIALLESTGFEDCGIIVEPEAEGLAEGSYLIYGRKADQVLNNIIPPFSEDCMILCVKADQQFAQAFREKLTENGIKAEISLNPNSDTIKADNLILVYRGKQPPENTAKVLSDLNSLILGASPESKIWIITNGVYPSDKNNIDPVQAAIAGFTRVANSEKAGLKIRLRDLSPDLSQADAIDLLYQEIAGDTEEDEISLSEEGRQILLLTKGNPPFDNPDNNRYKLDITNPGRLDNLTWLADEKIPLGDNDVEARVMATGLNFRDIMLAMGLLPEDALENGFAGPNFGLEFSGVVTAAGKNVKNFVPGERVAGFAPACFASHVRMPENALTHVPQEMDYTAAAAIPTIFITAWYALKHLAGLQKGEKLLIHGGAGGVGLAAIQIGKMLGAEIFATAGTEEKRDYLRLLGVDHIMDSRSLDFADEIMEITDGEGIDVVLNSLAGEAMRRSMSLLKPFGRFLELGKRDYVENTSIGLRPFKENISYFSIDVDQLLTVRPNLANTLFTEVMDNLRNGQLTPPPLKVFKASQVEEAFRTMQQAKHMGKVVVDMRELPAIPDPAEKNKYDGVWLISGGTSGFGLETARHLARGGAKTLVLASRRGEKIAEADALREEFSSLGTQIFLKSCDFSSKNDVDALINWISLNLPPLTGIVHAAAVFDDRRLENLDQASFERSLNPKMLGALHLHEATQSLPIKYFVLFSSISVALGNPGQGNYVAANAALEALTHLRNSRNLPSSCLAWGPIGDSGYLSRNEAVQKNLAMQLGKAPLTSQQAMEAFDIYSGENGVHILANINWRRALEFAGNIPGRLGEVYQLCSIDDESGISADFTSSLLGLSREEAIGKLKKIIASETAKVLGMDAALTPHDKSLQALGLDSLMAMELALGLEQATGLRLPPMLLQDAPTIEQLAARLWERLDKPVIETAEEAMVEDLARRHSEELKPEDIKDLLKNIEVKSI